MDEAFLVVGLGNPGPRYAMTRHNAGFSALDRLAKAEGVVFRRRGEALIAPWGPGWLMKPLTYMNLSGTAVAPFVRSKGLSLERVLVVHDDMDLPLGRIRFKRGGSAAGQRGVQSIIEALGDPGFDRLRIGVGRPPAGIDPVSWVLSRFPPDDAARFERVIEHALEAIRVWREAGLAEAQTRFNGLRL